MGNVAGKKPLPEWKCEMGSMNRMRPYFAHDCGLSNIRSERAESQSRFPIAIAEKTSITDRLARCASIQVSPRAPQPLSRKACFHKPQSMGEVETPQQEYSSHTLNNDLGTRAPYCREPANAGTVSFWRGRLRHGRCPRIPSAKRYLDR